MSKTTTTRKAAAAAFLSAFLAFQSNRDRAALPALNRDLDAALNQYREAHALSSACGLLDCVNHYNREHAATGEQEGGAK